MGNIKKLIKMILFPGMPAILFFAVTAIFFYMLSFVEKQRSNVFAFIAYTVTAYVLITVIAEIPKVLIQSKRKLWGEGKSTCIIFSKETRTKLALYFGWLLNLVYAAFKMLVSVVYNSFWFSTEAIYYLMLGVIRFTLVKFEKEDKNNLLSEWKAYRLCGYLMLVVNVLITVIIIISVYNHKVYSYSQMILYATGIYAVYRLLSSLIQMTTFRKNNRPVLSAAKAINISASALSLFTFFSTLINYSGKLDYNQTVTVIAATVCTVIICVSLFMIIRSNLIIKKIENR